MNKITRIKPEELYIFNKISPIEAFSLYVFNKLTTFHIISLANYWLENDIYSESLCKLCYVDNTDSNEINFLFKSAMNE